MVGTLQLAPNVNSLEAGQVTAPEPVQVSIPACARFERIDLRTGCLTLGLEGPAPFVQNPKAAAWKFYTFLFSFLSRAYVLVVLICMIGIITPFTLILLLSPSHTRFSQHSPQQNVVLGWLLVGSILGLAYGVNYRRDNWAFGDNPRRSIVKEMFLRVVHCGPAIGGLVAVGRMLKEYGDCRRL